MLIDESTQTERQRTAREADLASLDVHDLSARHVSFSLGACQRSSEQCADLISSDNTK